MSRSDLQMVGIRAGRLRRSVADAVAAARKGAKVVWCHPGGSPPPAWAAEELRAAGVQVVAGRPVLSGTNASRIEMHGLTQLPHARSDNQT